MPIPVLLYAVVLGAGVLTTRMAVRRIRKPLAVVVAGQSLTGKTCLINAWLGEWQDDPKRTFTPTKVGTVRVDTGKKVLFVQKKFVFRKLHDISGWDQSMATFDRDIRLAEVVLYLINAVHLHQEELREPGTAHSDEWVRIVDDSSRLKARAVKADRVVVVVTHVDLDPRYLRLDAADYQGHIAKQLANVTANIGDPTRIRLVAGSLQSEHSAKALTDDIIGNLL